MERKISFSESLAVVMLAAASVGGVAARGSLDMDPSTTAVNALPAVFMKDEVPMPDTNGQLLDPTHPDALGTQLSFRQRFYSQIHARQHNTFPNLHRSNHTRY
jgi:hypothetical protein